MRKFRPVQVGRPKRLFVSPALLALWTSALPVAASASPPCAEQLRMTGAEAESLRTLLTERGQLDPEAPCAHAEITLTRHDGVYHIALMLGHDQVERDVATLADASTWIESWLMPLRPRQAISEGKRAERHGESGLGTRTPPEAGAATPREAQVPIRAPSALGRMGLAALGAEAIDRTFWAGPELSGKLVFSDRLWFGGAVSALEDVTTHLDDDGKQRRFLKLGVRLGGRWSWQPPLSIELGFGAGLVTALSSVKVGSEHDEEDEAGIFGEVALDVDYRFNEVCGLTIGPSVVGILGIGERETHPQGLETQLLPARPDAYLALLVGVGCTLARIR